MSVKKVIRQSKSQWLYLAALKVCDQAQRGLNQSWVDALVANFQLESMRKPVVNKRADGHYYIIDGQHTVAALKQFLGDGWQSQQIECEAYVGLSLKEEADKFDLLNNRKTVSALDRFRVRVVADRELETAVDEIVRDLGLVVSKDAVPGAVRAVGTICRVYQRSDGETLRRALKIIRDAYGDPGMEAPVIDGVGYLCARYNGQLRDADAVSKLAAIHGGVGGLLGKAQVLKKAVRKPLSQCVAAACVEIINRNRGGKKLPAWWREEE